MVVYHCHVGISIFTDHVQVWIQGEGARAANSSTPPPSPRNEALFFEFTLKICLPHQFVTPFKKWQACRVQLSSYGCTREVAKYERSVRVARGYSFLSTQKTSQVHPDNSIMAVLHAYHFFYNIEAFQKHFFLLNLSLLLRSIATSRKCSFRNRTKRHSNICLGLR